MRDRGRAGPVTSPVATHAAPLAPGAGRGVGAGTARVASVEVANTVPAGKAVLLERAGRRGAAEVLRRRVVRGPRERAAGVPG